jgi:hypothetical protein
MTDTNITRNAGAKYSIPSENEWYKAAYYKGRGTNAGYWRYATQSNVIPSNLLNPNGTNNANRYDNGYSDPFDMLTTVGSFASSPSAYGTFDQSGNVYQWNEGPGFGARGLRGGSFTSNNQVSDTLVSTLRITYYETSAQEDVGFRIAAAVDPSQLLSGDFNFDNQVTTADIPAMLSALVDLNKFKTTFGLSNDDLLKIGDINQSGAVTNADIQAELDLVASVPKGSIATVPEPSTLILAALGLVIVWRMKKPTA